MLNRKKVLFFVSASVGGAERVSITIGKMLSKEKYEVVFVLFGKSRGNISDFIPSDYRIEYLVFKNVWLGVGHRVYKLIKREQPYAVFCSIRYFSIRVIAAAKRIGGINIVIRNDNYFKTLRWDQLKLCQLTFKYADFIIAQQEEMRQDILEHITISPDKVIALQNPLDKGYIEEKVKCPSPYKESDAIKYLWVARFARTKGQDVLARAFTIVAKKSPNAQLYFVGKYSNDEFFNEVQRIIMEGGCGNKVHFIGFDSNPYRWMEYCDCYVLSSRIEGLPNSLIEAQYLGRPAVATTCIPIISRIVEEGKTGYLVPPNNPEAMAEAMLKAPALGKIESHFQSADDNDFIKLFE